MAFNRLHHGALADAGTTVSLPYSFTALRHRAFDIGRADLARRFMNVFLRPEHGDAVLDRKNGHCHLQFSSERSTK